MQVRRIGPRREVCALEFAGRLRYQSRMNRESIDGLARRLVQSLPESLRAVREDVEANFRAVLKSGLARMDLVTREEFEVQQLVLERTRAKLDALEARLAGLEQAPAAAAPAARKSKKKTKKKAKKKAAGKTGDETAGD